MTEERDKHPSADGRRLPAGPGKPVQQPHGHGGAPEPITPSAPVVVPHGSADATHPHPPAAEPPGVPLGSSFNTDEAASGPSRQASEPLTGSDGSMELLQGTGGGSAASSEAGSSAYPLVLELILETHIQGDGDDGPFSPTVVDLDDARNEEEGLGFAEPVVFFAQGGAPGPGHCFFLDNCTDEELTTVRMVVPDVPGVLSASTQAFEANGLDIVHCQMDQMDGLRDGWAYIECIISTDDGDRVEGFQAAHSLCQEMRRKLADRLAVAKRRSHQRTRRTHARRPMERWNSSGRNSSTGVQEPLLPPPVKDREAAEASAAAAAASAAAAAASSSSSTRNSSSSFASASRSGSFEAPSAAAKRLSSAAEAPPAAALQGGAEGAAIHQEEEQKKESSPSPSHSPPPPPPAPPPAAAAAAAAADHDQLIPAVASVMMGPPSVVLFEASVEEAILVLDKQPGRTCLLIDNGPGNEPGLVTWKDLVGALDSGTAVGEVQSRPIVTICPSDLTTMAAELMDKIKVTRLLVKVDSRSNSVDQPGQIIGEVRKAALGSRDQLSWAGPSQGAPAVASAAGSSMAKLAAAALSAWEIPFSDIAMLSRVGQGSFGEVWHGRWRGTDVAVKRVWGLHESIEETAKAAADFEREMSLLSRLRHPNVVMFMGACSVSPDVALVMEYCPRGTLHRLLHRSTVELPVSLRVRMAVHVARGMLALHSSHPKIIHRDLKTANLLVGASFEVKVCDFGLSRTMENAANCMSNRSQGSFGTVEYAAPEVLRGEPYSEKCDVWSFGVVLWELISRRRPYIEVAHSVSIIAGVSLGKLSLGPIPESTGSDALQKIIDQCLSLDPTLRPSFSELLLILEQEANALKKAAPRRQRPDHVILRQATASATSDQGLAQDAPDQQQPSGILPSAGSLESSSALEAERIAVPPAAGGEGRLPTIPGSLESPFTMGDEAEESSAPSADAGGQEGQPPPSGAAPSAAAAGRAWSIESPFAQFMINGS